MAEPKATAPTVSRKQATRSELAAWLGIYRDPWLGDVSICEKGDGVWFSTEKSPSLSGGVYRAGTRWLVDWQDASVDTEAWLDFADEEKGGLKTLKMAKVDPEADFSSDFEDLAFSRVRDCPGR